MSRDARTPLEGRIRANPNTLRAIAADCETAAEDLKAITKRVQTNASRLSGPAGCAEELRALCDAAGHRANSLLLHSATSLNTHGQALRRAAARLEASDHQSADTIHDSTTK